MTYDNLFSTFARIKNFFSSRQHPQYDYRQVFLDFNESLHTIKDKSSLISSVMTRIYELVQAQTVYMFWQNYDTTRYVLTNPQETNQKIHLNSQDGLIRWLQLNEKPLVVSFVPEYKNIFSECDLNVIQQLNGKIICPLKANNQLRGVIMIDNRKDEKTYHARDIEILSILLDSAALAIENITYNEERIAHLKHMIQTDRLAVTGQLAAGAAHEIRNPLTSIKSAIQFVQNDIQDPQKQKIITSILSEVNRINDILTGLLSFSRQNQPVKREFDLIAMMNQTLLFIQHTHIKKKIHFITQYHTPNHQERSTLPIVADHDQLKQVVMNIVLNAIDAIAEEGFIRIEIYPFIKEGTKFYHILFTDNGIGIHEDLLEKIFDPFFTTKKEGTGLGLSISYGIVHNHGGIIEIRNHPDGGTQVEIKLPDK